MSTALVDTHVLVWIAADPGRISKSAAAFLAQADRLAISGLTAFEYEDLRISGRLPDAVPLTAVIAAFDLSVLAPPVDLWMHAAALPAIHRDPIDRMVVAHAIGLNVTLVTADAKMRKYSVRSLW